MQEERWSTFKTGSLDEEEDDLPRRSSWLQLADEDHVVVSGRRICGGNKQVIIWGNGTRSYRMQRVGGGLHSGCNEFFHGEWLRAGCWQRVGDVQRVFAQAATEFRVRPTNNFPDRYSHHIEDHHLQQR